MREAIIALLPALPIGIGATIVMDLFGLFRSKLLGQPFADYGLVGRWLAHMLAQAETSPWVPASGRTF